MADNIHPVVELLAARMESHPEEFRIYDNSTLAIGGRWETWIAQIRPFMNEAEHKALFNTAKEAFLQRVHEEVLDELLNGPERRAEEARKHQEDHERWTGQLAAAQQQIAGTQQYQNALSSSAYAAQLQQAYAQAGLRIEHDLANQQYRISNGTIGEVVDVEEIRGPGVLERMLNRLIK